LNSKNQVKVLFEVKTDLSTTSIYSAIGQLMLHGAAHSPAPRKVMVLPGTPDSETSRILEKIGIDLISYDIGEGTVFEGLEKILSNV